MTENTSAKGQIRHFSKDRLKGKYDTFRMADTEGLFEQNRIGRLEFWTELIGSTAMRLQDDSSTKLEETTVARIF
jgi:hypothetical protein